MAMASTARGSIRDMIRQEKKVTVPDSGAFTTYADPYKMNWPLTIGLLLVKDTLGTNLSASD